MTIRIISINYETHDHTAALVEDERILTVVSEERLTRKKMEDAPPVSAIYECLHIAGYKPEDIDYVVHSVFPSPRLKYYAWEGFAKILLTRGQTLWKSRSIPRLLFDLVYSTGIPTYLIYNLWPNLCIHQALKGFRGKIHYVNHHLSHAAAAFYTSGMTEALAVVIEGSGGDYTTSAWIAGADGLKPVAVVQWPHSLGQFYRLITRILGFNVRRHAGKITGLAALGDSTAALDLVRELVRCDGLDIVCSPLVYTLQSEYLAEKKIPTYFKNHRREDLAASFQRRLEEVALEFVTNAMKASRQQNLVLAGGVTANVRMNQKLAELSVVKKIFIHPGMGDDGIALGAALYTMSELLRKEGKVYSPPRMEHVYLGPSYSSEEIRRELKKTDLNYHRSEAVEVEIAKYLAAGKVVARFNGRMEYGPRALGNRSILYSPVDRSVNDWLNKRLRRTEFMPFAPSTLAEYASQCFKNVEIAAHACQFMTITLDCTEWMKENCPAVVHIDGTARPHFVYKEINPSYYLIIDEFRKLTGLPVVVNTSFNMHEEPIVCSPQDAIRAFQLGHLDLLAINEFIVVQK